MQETIVRKTNCPGMEMQSFRLMGNHFEISVPSSDRAGSFIHAAVEEIRRIERLLTTYNDESLTNLINRNAGISPVTVDAEVFELIERSLKISDLTQGAFDITYGSVDKRFWNFDKNMTSLPDRKDAQKRVELINYRNVILNKEKRTVFLCREGMKIGFGGIGKGYAAERAKALLKKLGVESGIVNAAGDLSVWGKQPDGRCFTVGIADPELADCPFSYLELSDMAVATSGNYEKYVMINGKRYSHTIDPRTGYPVSGIKSVTIICRNAEIADAIATPVMVMGVKAGLDLVNQIRGMECIIIDDLNRLYVTDNIWLYK